MLRYFVTAAAMLVFANNALADVATVTSKTATVEYKLVLEASIDPADSSVAVVTGDLFEGGDLIASPSMRFKLGETATLRMRDGDSGVSFVAFSENGAKHVTLRCERVRDGVATFSPDVRVSLGQSK